MPSTLKLALALVVGCSLPACNATHSDGDIDTSLLVEVPESERGRIDDARLEIGRRADDVARAERNVNIAQDELGIVEPERATAESRVEQAEARVELAIEQGETQEQLDVHRGAVDEANAYRRWVEARIARREAGIDQARADLERAQAQEELAKAHLQLLQARALEDLGRPDTADIDVDTYQRKVDELELKVGDAEIEFESAQRRAALRDDVVATRAEAVPARFRTGFEEDDSAAREAAAKREEVPEDD